jgi:subfamily B ATP-binding cassette protein MsbA
LSEPAQQGLAAAHSIFSLLDEQAEPDSETAEIARARGELRFEHVSFAGSPDQCREIGTEQTANGCSMLQGISLTVHPGEMVALVSFQESSIIALANLVPLFFHPARGKIFLDGQDVESISLASLRANIALVSCDATLFNDTLAANIAYGEVGQVTEARIMSAAYEAHVSEFARALPEGMQTGVGVQGKRSPCWQLTSGQRFRIAVARALLKDSPILILNETGEAFDAESVPHVEAALEAVTRGRTTLVVARRLSTVTKAKRVVLLHKGHIAAIGTHNDLLARNEIYGRLARTFT